MKHTLAAFGLVGLALFGFTSFSPERKRDDQQEPEKTRHIKLTKIENGKKMELDTVIAGNDVFIWNGDTIGGKELGKHLSPSGFDQMKHVDVFGDRNGRNEKVMIYHHKDGKGGKPMIWHMDSGEDMEIVTEDVDSVGKRIIIRKKMKDGDAEHHIYLNEPNMKHFPPMPPMPPMRHMKMMKGANSGRVIDLNDPNIISYKKKELSGDREKIEIIRKKSDDAENMDFDFKFDDELMPPEAPALIREYEGDNQKKQENN